MTQHSGDILRITPVFTITPYLDRLVNSWHVELVLDESITDGDCALYLGVWLELLYVYTRAHMSTSLNFVEWDWANETQDTVYPAELWPVFDVGLASGDYLPQNVAGYFFGRTNFPKVYGKKWVPGYTELNNGDTGQPSTNALVALAQMGVFGYGSSTLAPGVTIKGGIMTKSHGFVVPSVVVAKAQWRALRRRVPGVGG